MLPDMQYAMQQSQQALATAEQQVATGNLVNQPSDDPTASANMVVSLANMATVDQYTSNVTALQSQMQMADSSISAIITTLNSAITTGTEGANSTENTADRQALASQIEGDLSSVISEGNSTYQGAYLFAGSASSAAPFVAASTTYTSANGSVSSPLAATTALTAGSVTTISDATTGETMTFKARAGDTIATLQAAVASAASSGEISSGVSATINASGQLSIGTPNEGAGIVVSSNDAVLGSMSAASGTQVANAYAYVGDSTVNSVQIGTSLDVSTNLPGNTLLTAGPNVIGSLSKLITALQSGTTAEISAAVGSVSSALNHVSEQRVPLDFTINQLDSQDSYLSQEKITLTSQETSLVGANLPDAATNLSQAELQNSTVMAAAAKVLPQTLLQYLQP
jgi:flagellar hook-associated protein 3 FlgL